MKIVTRSKIGNKLQARFNRIPKEDEITNAEKDPNVICEILIEELEALEIRISKLEKP